MAAHQAVFEGTGELKLKNRFQHQPVIPAREQEKVVAPEGLPLVQVRQKFNNFILINEELRRCHRLLAFNGLLLGYFEPLEQRTRRLKAGKKKWHGKMIFIIDFLFYRLLPKITPFKQVVKKFHLIRNRAVSKCEMLGRLMFCGFEVKEVWEDEQYMHFIAAKVAEPLTIKHQYGLLYAAKRIGRNGRTFKMYKIRTMHPYAEYLQKYTVEHNHLAQNGKIKDDFRVTEWATWLRRYFIDELPQLINLFKGDIRLVGVRPLSPHFYSLYPEDLQQERIRYRPGLIPPYYADMPKSFEEIVESERRYLASRRRRPFVTDCIYLYRAVRNILFNHAHSA